MKKLLSILFAVMFILSTAVAARAEETESFLTTITPENYFTVSNPENEKLSCAPSIINLNNEIFAITYLADDINTVETEASTTIVCRLGLFNINNPECGEFFDIATAGQSIGNIKISNRAPYEPNLLKIDNNTLLVIFNVRDTNGNYTYYCAVFDVTEKSVISYIPLTLDGNEWNPKNIASSYNSISENKISSAGPTGSMVFTSQIIRYDGYFYGFCGGICDGFSGILVRSRDGINWESVMSPESSNEINGIIECGFQILNDTIYFCMRDISSGVFHCSYKFSTQEQVYGLSKLSHLTTSKPNAFIKDDKIFLIVNKATGDDNTVGRRNTALFYLVDPNTCTLSLAKQVFCKDGCAYHATVQHKDKIYWCFHTDARRINPYTQGRSNIAFLKLPEMFISESTNNGNLLNFDSYFHMYSKGCITSSANIWQSSAVNYHYQIPLSDFSGYDKITITANSKNKAYIAFFASYISKTGAIDYAEGWEKQVIIEPGISQSFEIPKNAKYLYILNNNAAGNNLIPESVIFGYKNLVFGDINLDGKVNTIDANYARRYAAGLLTLDERQKLAADVSGDGEINVMDSSLIRRYVVKYIDVFPAEEK